ncbi:MAG: NAD(P)-binding protein [Streptosporangiaceae bacterium]
MTLARAGLTVHVIEGASTPGGGCRTQELTLPGFQHDVCSAVHPLAAVSPFLQKIDLAALGVTLRTPKVAFAHPLDGGHAAACNPAYRAGLEQAAAVADEIRVQWTKENGGA